MTSAHTTTLLGCILVSALIAGRPAGASGGSDGNQYVRVTVALLDSVMRPGTMGTLAVTFSPAEDIHVNAEPPVEFSISSSNVFRLSGSPSLRIDKKSGYLSTRSPITQQFVLDKRARPGRHQMKGRLVYFYCSDSAGWCRRHVVPLDCVVRIVR